MVTPFQQHIHRQQKDVSEAGGTISNLLEEIKLATKMLYEANSPASFAEQAGGMALGASGRILEIEPEGSHQQTAFVVGGTRDMAALAEVLGR